MKNLIEHGILAKAFPGDKTHIKSKQFLLDSLLSDMNQTATAKSHLRFEKAGMMVDRQVITTNYRPKFNGSYQTLADVLEKPERVPESFYIDEDDLEQWRRKRHRIPAGRIKPRTGSRIRKFRFPDPTALPSRTIMTQEGGRSPNWNTHVIKTQDGRHRRLLPIELERLNMFPDNHTEGVIDSNRAFLMGNALVIGVIERIGYELAKEIMN